MNKKQKEKIRKEFLKNRPKIIVFDGNCRISLLKYIRQEQYARIVPLPVFESVKREYIPQDTDTGILSPESRFEIDLWYMRNIE